MRRLLLLVLILGITGCGKEAESDNVYKEVAPATLQAGDPIPAPQNAPVLILQGQVGTTNSADTVQFDMETLEKLGLIEYTIDDPFLNRKVTYTGVLVTTLLKVAKVPESVTTVNAIALNDYTVNIPLAELTKWPVMIATKRDGERMPIDDKGPLEIVFPTHAFKFDENVYLDYWAWQLKTLEFR